MLKELLQTPDEACELFVHAIVECPDPTVSHSLTHLTAFCRIVTTLHMLLATSCFTSLPSFPSLPPTAGLYFCGIQLAYLISRGCAMLVGGGHWQPCGAGLC